MDTRKCEITTCQIATGRVDTPNGYYIVIKLLIDDVEIDLTKSLGSKVKAYIYSKLN